MAIKRLAHLVWIHMTLLVGYRLQATAAQPDHTTCNEQHRKCVRDARFQNCSDTIFAPTISKAGLVNISIKVNHNAKFKCLQKNYEAGLTGLQFDWIKWDMPFAVSEHNLDFGNFTVIEDTNPKYTQKPGKEEELYYVSYLWIHNVTQDDIGLYSCIVCNQHGRDYRSAFLSLNTTAVSVIPTTTTASTSKTHSTTSNIGQQRIKVIIGCIGASIGVVAAILIFFLIWKRKELKHQGLPRILQETNSTTEERDSALPLPVIFQNGHSLRDSLVPLIHKRNSSYRSQLSSSASGGTILTFADDIFEDPLDEKWEVPRESIFIKDFAGEGAFGYVAKAEAFELPGNITKPCTVAVKMLKENATDAELSDLISEMETMKEIGSHKNIVNFLGACTVQGPLFLIVEYCPHGNLRDFLRDSRPSLLDLADEKAASQLTFRDLLSMAYQITRGMSYLSSKKCIHRDLAARNVLIAEDFVIKIADFGLARNLGNTDYYRRTTHGRLPVKWLAIEALFDQQYTVKTDVWSFGILLWEIFTLGGTPYPGIPVERLFTILKNGYRMECPINCPPKIYEIMLKCWGDTAKTRPSFSELCEQLDEILSTEAAQEYIEILSKSVDCLADVDMESDKTTESGSSPEQAKSNLPLSN